jgi:chemotaxis protein methyltransferase CheR
VSLSTLDFDYVRTVVHKGSAIVLEESKVYLAESRLAILARREGFASAADLVARLRVDAVAGLRQKVVEAMTTNETYFFRDMHPFEALRQVLLPRLVQQRALERQLNIWCAACSTGQEPYSIAMLLREHFPELATWRVSLLATDLSAEVLERARRGVYTQMEISRGLPAPLLVKYFSRRGLDWHLCPEVRGMVEFRRLNLIEPWPVLPPMDIILLRNVLIYFDVQTKKRILANVRQLLRTDACLFLGGAETTFNLDDEFQRVECARASCYQLRQPQENNHAHSRG